MPKEHECVCATVQFVVTPQQSRLMNLPINHY